MEGNINIDIGKTNEVEINISNGSSSGVDNFLELDDTPSSYSGYSNKFIKVKDDETGLEFSSYSQPVTSVNGNTGVVVLDTDDISEGSNQYFTNERVDDRVSALLVNSTGISISYNDTLNTLNIASTITQYTNSNAISAVGNNLVSSSTIIPSYNIFLGTISHSIASNSVAESYLVLADTTSRNSTTSAHGYLPKLSGNSNNYLNGNGSWATPSATSWGSIIGDIEEQEDLTNYLGSNYLALNNDLISIGNLTSTGIITRIGTGSETVRSIAGTTNNISVTNGNGVSANPTIDLTDAGTPITNSLVKITTDTKGRVTSSTSVSTADITSLVSSVFVKKSGDTIDGNLQINGDQELYNDDIITLGMSDPSGNRVEYSAEEGVAIISSIPQVGAAAQYFFSGSSLDAYFGSGGQAHISDSGASFSGAISTGFSYSHLDHGTYNPTLTNVANVSASTAYTCHYMRVGNSVSVSGRVDVDPTITTTSTQLGISFPIASDITSTIQCSGVAFSPGIAGQGAAILGDATNNRAQMQWISTDITNQPMYFNFMYTIA